MSPDPHDPRDIPILTDAVEKNAAASAPPDAEARHAAILTETLELADALLRKAAKDVDAAAFETVFSRLRAQIPELVDHAMRGGAAPEKDPDDHG